MKAVRAGRQAGRHRLLHATLTPRDTQNAQPPGRSQPPAVAHHHAHAPPAAERALASGNSRVGISALAGDVCVCSLELSIS